MDDGQYIHGVRISAEPSSRAGSSLDNPSRGARIPARKHKESARKRQRAVAQHTDTVERNDKPDAGRRVLSIQTRQRALGAD
jgi:hypothetical protein